MSELHVSYGIPHAWSYIVGFHPEQEVNMTKETPPTAQKEHWSLRVGTGKLKPGGIMLSEISHAQKYISWVYHLSF